MGEQGMKKALISVSDKQGILSLSKVLIDAGYEILLPEAPPLF